MCVISDKIKFCTCVDATIDIRKRNHYWVLIRYNKRKVPILLGEIAIGYNHISANRKENQEVISKVLSETDAFDKPIRFKEKDILQIVLHNHSKNHMDVLKFKLEYKSGQWQVFDSNDFLYIKNHFDETDSGEIKEII